MPEEVETSVLPGNDNALVAQRLAESVGALSREGEGVLLHCVTWHACQFAEAFPWQ